MPSQLKRQVKEALAEGFEVIQRGKITRPYEQGVTFSDRAEGFRIGLLGSYPPPTYRGVFENRLFDDEKEWVHLQRRRGS